MFSCGLYREPSVHLCFWTPRLLQHSDVLEIKASLISLAESLKFWHVYRLFVLFFFFLLCGFLLLYFGSRLTAFFLLLCQALEAISEVGDLLQLKYSRREQPLPLLGWMSEESLLQD